jgi:hypothetical protein
MQGLGLTPPECPSPFNLFMNIPWQPDGKISFDPPTTKPGDYVTLRAELDCVVAIGLPAGHPADQRPHGDHDRGALRDPRLRENCLQILRHLGCPWHKDFWRFVSDSATPPSQ